MVGEVYPFKLLQRLCAILPCGRPGALERSKVCSSVQVPSCSNGRATPETDVGEEVVQARALARLSSAPGVAGH